MKNALRSQKKTPTHTPSLPQNGLHIGPNLSKLCHPLAREGDKKMLSATPFGALIFLNIIWCKMVFIPQKNCYFEFEF